MVRAAGAEHANLRAALAWLDRARRGRAGAAAGRRALSVLVPPRPPARRDEPGSSRRWPSATHAPADRARGRSSVPACWRGPTAISCRPRPSGAGRSRSRTSTVSSSASATVALPALPRHRDAGPARGSDRARRSRPWRACAQAGARAWLAYVLGDVGMRLAEAGDRERGAAWIEEGLALHRELGNKQGLGNKLSDLGRVSHEAGDVPSRRAALRGEPALLVGGVATPGTSPARSRDSPPLRSTPAQAEQAARLLGAAAALRERSGGAIWPAERGRLERAAAAARAALGEEAYARAAAAGRALSLPEVVAEATAVADAFPEPASPAPACAGRGRRPFAPRAGGAAAAGRREVQPRDRRSAVHRPRDGQDPRRQHPRQARRPIPRPRPRPSPTAAACSRSAPVGSTPSPELGRAMPLSHLIETIDPCGPRRNRPPQSIT